MVLFSRAFQHVSPPLEKSLQQRLKSSQDSLMEAIRQRDQARLEYQRLTLALRDAHDYKGQTESALLERLHECEDVRDIGMDDLVYIAIDVSDWPNTVDVARLVDVVLSDIGNEGIQLQFWLTEFKDGMASFEVCRLC